MTFSLTILWKQFCNSYADKKPKRSFAQREWALVFDRLCGRNATSDPQVSCAFSTDTADLYQPSARDHFFGLIGLLNSLHLLGEKKKLHLYGPPCWRRSSIFSLKLHKLPWTFHCSFIPLFSGYEMIYEDKKVNVHSFPLLHSIPTCGFIFCEKKAGTQSPEDKAHGSKKFLLQKCRMWKKPALYRWRGKAFKMKTSHWIRLTRSFAYCSDHGLYRNNPSRHQGVW